jgi:D-amino-acid dehydrogenase
MKRVVIVGGGAVGLATAYALQREGHSITLLDRDQPGQACSLHNAGLLVPSHFVPMAHPGVISQGMKWMLNPESPFYIKPRLDRELISWVWNFRKSSTQAHVHQSMTLLRDLCQTSLRLVRDLAGRDGLRFGLENRGLLMLFRTPAGRKACEEEARLAHTLGVEAIVLDRPGLKKLEPAATFLASGGVYYPGDAHLSPSEFMSALATSIGKAGVQIMGGTSVTGFVSDRNRIVAVSTTRGDIPGDEFVLAGGAWSPSMLRSLGITVPMQPGKGYSVTGPAPARMPSIPMIFTEARVVLTPLSGSIRFAGTMELAGLDLTINQRRVGAILDAVPRYLEGIPTPDRSAATLWSGLRPCTPDGIPYIGRFTSHPNLIAATGHAMLGITLAAVTGAIVADLVASRTPAFNLSQLSPERFN